MFDSQTSAKANLDTSNPNFNGNVFVQSYIYGKIFMKILLVSQA